MPPAIPEDIMRTASLTVQLITLSHNSQEAATVRIARLINSEREQWKAAIEDAIDPPVTAERNLHRSTELLLGRIKVAA
jgi:hypothetical protein